MITARESITDRILSTFPSGQYCLPALLRILEIVESTSVRTACVECVARPRMFINPEFVADHAQTPEKLLMLVLHELHHVILGHTRLYRRIEPLDNLVFDAVINAMLCRLFPDAESTAMFTDLYDEGRFPECVLRPPPGWELEDPAPAIPSALRCTHRATLAALHRALYAESGATYSELRDAFASCADDMRLDSICFLGDHSEEGDGSSSDGHLEHRAPVLLEELRRITERWPRPPQPITGRSAHELLEETLLRLPPPSNRHRLRTLLRRVGGAKVSGRSVAVEDKTVTASSIVPRTDRRSRTISALGGRTLLYQHELSLRRIARCGLRVHVYLDVSGSIGDLVGPLYAAVLECRELVHPVIHLFSTKIADVTLHELRQGVCRSTGGTGIECVAAHMRDNRVRRAVIITDGYVGAPGATAANTLAAAVLGVALTPGVSSPDDLLAVADHTVQLTENGQ